jgi:hypothetical protein
VERIRQQRAGKTQFTRAQANSSQAALNLAFNRRSREFPSRSLVVFSRSSGADTGCEE